MRSMISQGKYFDKQGRPRFVGEPKALKSTQYLASKPKTQQVIQGLASPRSYPSGLGHSLHQLYLEELKRPARGDLRVNLAPSCSTTPKTLFANLPLGDVWKDADLMPVWNYLFNCRHTRSFWFDMGSLWFMIQIHAYHMNAPKASHKHLPN